jgi:ribosome biogenesis GTPase
MMSDISSPSSPFPELADRPVCKGLVVRTHGGHYYVQSSGQIIDCTMRGRLKKEHVARDLVVMGDRVLWSPTEPGSGIIGQVLPRKTTLSRSTPSARGDGEQVIIANVDQVLIVLAMANPSPNPFLLDRYLVACEASGLPTIIVANKSDLTNTAEVGALLSTYEGIGYDVQYVSAVSGEGLSALRELLRGKISVLTGPSGVGKSSLLNALWGSVDLPVGEISQAHDRGKHTTVVAQLLNPEPDTYVADTPGLRQFRFWDIDPEQLEAFFPDMRPYLGHCRFTPCTHTHEPSCAVREAVERGEIREQRYESYVRMFARND